MHTRVVADGLGFTEGPVCLPDGRVALTSISHGAVYVVDPDGGPVERIETGGGPNGMVLGPDSLLYVAQNGGVWGAPGPAPAGVQVIDGTSVAYVVEGLGAPNDVVVGPDGRLWVTDTVAAFHFGDPDGARPGAVYAVDHATGACDQVLEGGPLFTNGLAFTPDGGSLLISATSPRELVRYRVTEAGLVDPALVVRFEGGSPDGIAPDGNGRYWVALTAGDRLDLVDLEEGVVDALPLPPRSMPTNVSRDHDGSGLYISAGLMGALLHVSPD